MKEYIAKKITREMTVEDERWENVEKVRLEYTWDEYKPIPYVTEAAMVHSDAGITVRMTTTEWPLRVTEMENEQRICADSCMEFFFIPNASEKKYVNVEINPAGACLFHVGEKKSTPSVRSVVPTEGSGMRIRTLISPMQGWTLMFFIPYTMIDALYDKRENVFQANFYKCGDLTVKRHYAAWNPVLTEKPSYHQPDFFGRIVLSEESL